MGTYAGDLDVADVWQALGSKPEAVLVDVRTETEWRTIGIPDLTGAGKSPVLIEWQTAPTMAINPNFVESLDAAIESLGLSRSTPVYFLCRSGARSQAAAETATAHGYTAAYNVSDGFEGPPGPDGRRGTVAGWQAAGLPWNRT